MGTIARHTSKSRPYEQIYPYSRGEKGSDTISQGMNHVIESRVKQLEREKRILNQTSAIHLIVVTFWLPTSRS